MGRLKQLLSLGSKTVIRHCLDTLLLSGIKDIVMVVGVGGEEIVNAVYGLPVRVARNLDPESEVAESVRVGLRAVNTESSGIIVCLSDNPEWYPYRTGFIHREHRHPLFLPGFYARYPSE